MQMSMQKVISPLAIDRMGPIKELDFRLISQTQLGIVPPDFCILEGDPLVDPHAIVMSPLDHERTWCHQDRKFRIVGYVAHIPFKDFIFRSENIGERDFHAGVL